MDSNDFIFELGRFTFLYAVVINLSPLSPVCEFDLIEVFFNKEPMSDDEMDAVNCEGIYDLALAAFQKQRL